MTTNKYIDLKDSKFISINGPDRLEFIQGLITNDIKKCSSNNPIYSCLLSPQGKFLADFFIINLNEYYLFEINEKFLTTFVEKINTYKLRSKVEIESIDNLDSIIIFKEIDNLDSQHIVFNDPRSNIIGKKIILNKKSKKNFIFKEKLILEEFEFYRNLLINNKIPYSPEDLQINKSLLLENNFNNLNAIDWNKGCYVGQEITARMNYRALIKKQIQFFDIISGKIEVGEKIIFKDKDIGEILSKSNSKGIAMLKIEDTNKIKNELTEIKTKNGIIKIIN